MSNALPQDRLDRAIMALRLADMIAHLRTLRKAQKALTLTAYLEDFEQQLAIERLIHLILETALAINADAIAASGSPLPQNCFDSFVAAGGCGLISPELAAQLALSASLQYRQINEYDDLSAIVALQSIQHILKLCSEYVRQVKTYAQRSLS
ncbi:MAG: DUF86 domain-containing protein [Leptolyngbya sp. SIO4C1]|nr:DUF86 domain-containing protein [Leptolyngbya sp. SIO4C1]